MVSSVKSQSKIDDCDFPQKSRKLHFQVAPKNVPFGATPLKTTAVARSPTDGVDQGSSLGMITTDASWAKFPLEPQTRD